MYLFKKKVNTIEFGTILYSNIRYLTMSQDSPFYNRKLITELKEDFENNKLSYSIEIIMFMIFCIFNGLAKIYKYETLKEVMDKINEEFKNHIDPLLEIDLCLSTKHNIIELLHTRIKEYDECLKNNTGAGPAWHLGVRAYWNIIGQEKEDPFPPTVLSMYALEIENIVRKIINDHRIVNTV